MLMNPAQNLLPSSDYCSKIRSNMEAIGNIPLRISPAQLKNVFQDILFNHKFIIGSQFFNSNWRSQSTSASDSTSNTLYYEEYTRFHTVLSKEDIEGLRSIARILSSSGYLHDCAQLYIERRRGAVNMIYRQLHKKLEVKAGRGPEFGKESKEAIQWWIQVAKVSIGDIFVKEKRFYKQIFGDLAIVRDADDFVHIIADAATKLFEFLGFLMACRQLSRRLEILLPLYEELLDQMSALNTLLPNHNLNMAKNIYGCATRALFQIAQHITRIFTASERQVLRELSIIPTPGGKIHPMTENVIRYIDLISNHKHALTGLIETSQVFNDVTAPGENSIGSEPIKHHVARIIEYLLCNLKHKSKYYKQESLGHLFMMNNVHHVAQTIQSSQGMQEIIDEDFQKNLTEEAEQAMSDYLNRTWNRVCRCLTDGRSKSLKLKFFSPNSSRVIKEKLKTFNHMLEKIHQNQVEWVVRDQMLQQKLHQSILNKLIPTYSGFLEQFSKQIEKLQNQGRYIKYSIKDLDIKISSLFQCQEVV